MHAVYQQLLFVFFQPLLSYRRMIFEESVRQQLIVDMAVAIKNDTIVITDLINIFSTLTKDISRNLRVAAYSSLGPLLARLPPSAITAELLAPYLHTSEPDRALVSTDDDSYTAVQCDELQYSCDYTFPAVVLKRSDSSEKSSNNFSLLLTWVG